jgi:hypothetical protein
MYIDTFKENRRTLLNPNQGEIYLFFFRQKAHTVLQECSVKKAEKYARSYLSTRFLLSYCTINFFAWSSNFFSSRKRRAERRRAYVSHSFLKPESHQTHLRRERGVGNHERGSKSYIENILSHTGEKQKIENIIED